MFVHTLILRVVHQWAHVTLTGKRITQSNRLGLGLEPDDKVCIQGLRHQHPTGGRAHLPGIEKAAQAGQFHRQFEVRFLQHQQRGFAAQFQAHALDRLGGTLHDLHAHRITAGEGDFGDPWIRRQRSAHRNPGATDQVEDTVRQTGFSNHRGQFQLRQWRDFRRFQHYAATGSQGRREFPCGGDHGEVPRHNQPDYTAWLAP
ncbi:hypothetical protein D3C79_707520 [compost metagenome]